MRLFIRDLQKNYGKNMVFRKVGYSFDEGVIYGLIGPKGSGKTTLFDCISGEVDYRGSIELEDDNKDILLPGLDTVSVSFQTPMIPEFLTGFEYIRYFLDVHKDEVEDEYSVEEYLRLVGIPMGMWGELIKNYSVDYKNRLQLIGLFIMESPITLIDEPCNEMPFANWGHIRALLNAFKPGRIVIVSTESEEVAKTLCDEIIYLENGMFTQVQDIYHDEDGAEQMTLDEFFPEEENDDDERDENSDPVENERDESRNESAPEEDQAFDNESGEDVQEIEVSIENVTEED